MNDAIVLIPDAGQQEHGSAPVVKLRWRRESLVPTLLWISQSTRLS